jgi:hypothetical protein
VLPHAQSRGTRRAHLGKLHFDFRDPVDGLAAPVPHLSLMSRMFRAVLSGSQASLTAARASDKASLAAGRSLVATLSPNIVAWSQ